MSASGMARKTEAADLIRELRADDQPIQKTTTLTFSAGSFTTTVMKEACDQAGRSQDDPGEVPQYFFEDEQMLVIDLQNDE